ncbi:MAG: peptidogalycan biosysnthesis protein [Candidatus Dormibacteria bacterium]
MFQELFRRPSGPAAQLGEEWVDSLDQLAPGEWAKVTEGCSLYLSYPYLSAVDQVGSTTSAYLTLRDQSGELVAGLPTYRWEGSADPGLDHYEPFAAGAQWVLGRRARAAPWRPTLIAGTRSGYYTEFAVHPAWGGHREQVVASLLRSAARRADHLGMASLGVMWLPSRAAREAATALTRPEYLILAGPNCAIDIEWDSLDGYLAQLSWSRRRSARRELECFRESGLTVETAQLGSCLDELAPLAVALQRKYHHAVSTATVRDELAAQARRLDGASRVLLCRERGRLVGFALFYSWEGTLYGRLAGFDYDRSTASAAYFNLAFYLPLQLALDERLGRLHLGMASWRTKVLRGAALDPAWTLACPPNPVRGAWLRAVRAQGDGPSRWWAEQFPRQVNSPLDWRWTMAGLTGAEVRPATSGGARGAA